MATRRAVLLHARDIALNISKPSLTKKLMKVLNFARSVSENLDGKSLLL